MPEAGPTAALRRRVMALWAPPPRESVTEWAEKNIVLPESSAEPGPFRISKTPWLREILDASNDPRVRKIVMMIAVQLAKTQAMLNVIGYRIDKRPCPILLLQPGQEDAEDFSKERLQPMIEDSAALSSKVAAAKSRSTSSTILRKDFTGGFIGLVGVNAPRGLRRRAIGLVVADEIDEYPETSGNQGNPLRLAEKRMRTFRGGLMVLASTPTIKDESAIEREYANSTQEQWSVPCPSCGDYQPYEWKRVVLPEPESGGRRSEAPAPGKRKAGRPNDAPKLNAEQLAALKQLGSAQRAAALKEITSDRPEHPEMACRTCGALHGEYDWKAGEGRWVAQREHAENRGFHMNSLASPWVDWDELAARFRQAVEEGPESLQTFINTELAEVWEGGEKINDDILKSRRHYYNCDVPDRVVWITCGVDVQKDRLEAEIVGWGPGEESWGIHYAVLPGDTQRAPVWNDLDGLISRSFARSDGVVLPIACVAVDSQYATSEVHSFTRPRLSRYVFAVRGVGGPGKPVVGKVTKQGKNRDVFVFPVGTDGAKDLIFSSLSLDAEGPGYCHFPREAADSDERPRGYDEAYFRGLLAERRVRKRSQGRVWHVWEKPKSSARNEPLDCRVYATAALKIRNPLLTEMADPSSKPDQSRSMRNRQRGARRGRRMINRGIE